MADPINVKSIFLAASEKPAAERSAFLDEATGSDTALRVRVEALLKAHDNPDSFLKEPAAEFGATIDLSPPASPLAERPGTLIGPYKLLEQIGEGGMGVVYMADQQVPVRRRVALKVIKTGMDTRQVIARFEAERQALALMDHTNIARVLDAGATESGRPYFVMELVRGVPITEYCDQNNLPVRERLELFVQVCSAVQHAHQKGIIHRDLKPSNVLVTRNDGSAVPKVIDFGVAKATGQQLTEKSLFTAFAQMVGTPLYMSPEQAEMTSLDIDTRSDIYSLGVLLYELLTGTTPFDQERMRSAAFDEIRRIIREEEPPKPSTRLSTLGESRTATAAHRQVDAHRLGRLMEGDLDWIVMKALEKDRARRYDTAGNFAADVLRHLRDQPVEACPPTTIYRFRKFARRNKSWLALALLMVAGLLMAVVGLSISNVLISSERNQKDAALKSAEDNLVLALKVLDEVYLQGIGQDRLLLTDSDGELPTVRDHVPFTDEERRLLERGLKFYEQFAIQNASRPDVRYQVAEAHRRIGSISVNLHELDRARAAFRQAVSYLEQLIADDPKDPTYWERLGRVYDQLNKTEQSETAKLANYQRAVHAFTKWIELQPTNSEAYIERMDIYRNLYDQGLSNEVIELAVADGSRAIGLEPKNARAHLKYALALGERDRSDPLAVEHAEEAVRLNPDDSQNHASLSGIYLLKGDYDQAVKSAKSAAKLSVSGYGMLATAYFYQGNLEQSLIAADEAFRLTRDPGIYYWPGRIREQRGDYTAAIADYDRVIAHIHSARGVRLWARVHRARCYAKLGRYEEAIEDWNIVGDSNIVVDLYRDATPIRNEFAWFLATCPDSKFVDGEKAVKLAEKAVQLSSREGAIWTTLGVAHYRAGSWQAAINALQKSIDLRQDGDAANQFFLAMAHYQLDHKDEARKWYDKAVKWMDKNQPKNEELLRFRAEAAELLGISEPAKSTDATTKP